jgi:hypothetical protein
VAEVCVEEALKEAELVDRSQGAQLIEFIFLQVRQEKAQLECFERIDRRHPTDGDPELACFPDK